MTLCPIRNLYLQNYPKKSQCYSPINHSKNCTNDTIPQNICLPFFLSFFGIFCVLVTSEVPLSPKKPPQPKNKCHKECQWKSQEKMIHNSLAILDFNLIGLAIQSQFLWIIPWNWISNTNQPPAS